MTPTRFDIRGLVNAYLERHPTEHGRLERLVTALEEPTEPTNRETLPGHITCSAIVIDRNQRVLHVHQRASGLTLPPGGRIEPSDRTLLAAALREVNEQAGIAAGHLCLTPQLLDGPIDIDVHDIAARPSKGEPERHHVDIRFIFYLADAASPQLALQDEEVAGVQWLPFADVGSPTLRAKLLAAEAAGLDGRPEPVNASALIHDGRGRYLLHLRDDRDGIWEPWTLALLGGGREPGDRDLQATLRRELAEEVPGLEPAGLTPYTVEDATSVDGLAAPIQVHAGLWTGDPEAVELREGVLLRWFTVDMLDRLRLSPGLADLIRCHAAEHPAAEGPPATARPLLREAPAGTELHIVGVHLHLEDEEGRVLLGLRHPDSVFAPDLWHFLAGHCEREAAIACLVREAREEAGLAIAPADVELVHTLHLIDAPDARPRIELIFRARSWNGTPEVLEPDRCTQWQWWNPQGIPAQVVPYTRAAIEGIRAGRSYTELGWDDATTPHQPHPQIRPDHHP
ncbi:NUDIX domain-containing protein [Streptomyces virginiae]|uniref:NUDIX domain-containing protein n=1 Tax=Streptomyces virginiae TaxID=1961 RepID=UPI0036946C36